MSFHDKERYPLHNTDEIRAALILNGLPTETPSQLSDAFRCGWISGAVQMSHELLIYLLDDHIDNGFSNSEGAVAIRDKLIGHKR